MKNYYGYKFGELGDSSIASLCRSVPVAPSGECSRGKAGAVDSIAVRRNVAAISPTSVYSAALRSGCCSPLCAADVVL